MGLSASMYSGTSGLKAHGEKMTVIGNNISNVSTIGFKGSRMYFEDALSQEVASAAGVGQVGRGVAVGTVMGDFSQGSLESTTESTDLAVGGNGFFMVSPAGEEINYYTRAGNFRFNEEGFLVDPHGYRVQGWAVQQANTSLAAKGEITNSEQTGIRINGVPQDIKLNNFQSPPQATSRVDMILNLDSKSIDKTPASGLRPPKNPKKPEPGEALYDGKPFTGLFDVYNYDPKKPEEEPLGDSRYAYQSTIKVYDDNGSAHNLTVYMDPVSDPDVTNNAGGKRYWEYIITVPPNEDNREFWGVQKDISKKGLLMAGVLTFNASGDLENMSAYTINNPYAAGKEPGTTPPFKAGTFAKDASKIENWTRANFSQNGYPICTANFLGAKNGSITATDDDATTVIIPPKDLSDPKARNNEPSNIEINFGLRNKDTSWTGELENLKNLQELVTKIKGGTMQGPDKDKYKTPQAALKALDGMSNVETNALTTTNYSKGSTTVFQAQDGYTSGFLQNISVDRNGIITGRYSNGQTLDLFAVTLATFNNNYALYREGGNLFSETKYSGPPLTGLANTAGKGSIASNTLEQSNVDLATEFVKMISTEKGFQANSKTITTVDQMLTTLIQLKR